MKITASRYHDFSYGHRVCGHEGKCASLHGHNGRVTFFCEAAQLDSVGRVIDFSVIKDRLCNWVEDVWDHSFLIWENDPWAGALRGVDEDVLKVSYNPTAENMAAHLLNTVGPVRLKDTGVTLTKVKFEETRKCFVEVTL